MELEDLITDDILNDNLQKCTNLDVFNKLLKIKKKRLLEGKTNKIQLSFEKIYYNFTDIQTRCEILNNLLIITENCDYKMIITNLINHIDLNNITTTNEENIVNILKFLNIFIEFSLNSNQEIQNYFNQLDEIIETVLKRSSKQSTNFIITQFLPNYLQLVIVDEFVILSRLLQTLKQSNRIEILFNLIDNFVLSTNNCRLFQLLEIINIWQILQDSLVTYDNYRQKQTKYLLLKIIDGFFDQQTPYIRLKEYNNDLVRKAWRNFFIILDTTNEKQLHLIQPSLYLLESLQYLHSTWRICLYRILLKHSQHSVVYFTAISILQQQNYELFKHICVDLLVAINLNEYSQISLKFFLELSAFIKRLSVKEITKILDDSLEISWNPTTIWCFYSSIFNDDTNIPVDIEMIEKLLEKIKRLPNIFIRNNLNRLILNNSIGNFNPNSCYQLLKFLTIIHKFDKDLFVDNLFKFDTQLNCYETELKRLFYDENVSNSCRVVLVEILQKDARFSNENLENNLKDYLESCRDNESIDDLLDSIRTHKNPKLLHKAIDFLEDCNNPLHNQLIIAFEIINVNYDESCNDYDGIFRKYHSEIWKNPKLLQIYLNLLLKHCHNPMIVEGNLEIFYKILDLQYDEFVCIFVKYLKDFMEFSKNSERIQRFISDLFTKIPTIDDNNLFKTIIKVVIDDLINTDLIDDKMLDFVKILIKSPNSNVIITDLMEKLSKITYKKPELFQNDYRIFIDLLFYGNIVNKTEKIEYCVYQDISSKLNIEHLNPNLDYLLVRLFAIDSLINLGKFNGKIADDLIVCLLEKYKIKSRKRYFPNSQIHLEKLRIMQTLILLQPFINDSSSIKLIDFIIDSFLNESHQLSVKYLMQLLLINLLITNQNSIQIISNALQKANYTRSTSISAFIPVLYQLTLNQNEPNVWHQVVKILLNYTMGPQFKLRLCSQIAIIKLYDSAKDRDFKEFLTKYQYLYQSVNDVVAVCDNDVDEFIEISNDITTTILYKIPKSSQVLPIEWENLQIIARNYKFFNITLNNDDDIFKDRLTQFSIDSYEINIDDCQQIDKIQKKIIPWRDSLIDNNLSDFILITTLIEKPSNLGGLSRTCEIFRIKQFVLNTINILNDREFKSLSMSSENWINFIEIKLNDLQQFLINIKTKGYCCIGAEQTSDSQQLQQFQFPKSTVLILGNEKEGIPPNLLPYLDYCIEIPQFGVVRSLNVHVAGAIFIWEYCKQHLL